MGGQATRSDVVASLIDDHGRIVDISRVDDIDGYVATVKPARLHPIRFQIDRTVLARMVLDLPRAVQDDQRRLDLEAEVLSIVEGMAERLATAAGVRWEKVSEPKGDEIVDRETRAYWRLLARTALGL